MDGFRPIEILDRRVLLGILTFASLGAIHYVSFALSLPSEFRPLLDIQFKASALGDFSLIAVFSWSAARYAPQAMLGIGAHIISVCIEFKYVNRGYDSVPVGAGLLKNGRASDRYKRLEYEERLRRFGRKSARFDNFVTDKIQSALPILWYEKFRIEITFLLCILIFLTSYVGLKNGVFLLGAALLLRGSLITYYGSNDRWRFGLLGRNYEADRSDYEPPESKLGSQDFLIAAFTAAVLTAISGPLRLNHLIDGNRVLLTSVDRDYSGAIGGVTAAGIVFFDERFYFMPFSTFVLEQQAQ